MVKVIVSHINRKGISVTYTWRDISSPQQVSPIFQVYGYCFTKDRKLCVFDAGYKKGFTPWNLPGGQPEAGETPEQTLVREVEEEVDLEISNLMLLGCHEVNFPNNPNKKKGDHYFQLRYFALVEKINARTPDPDTGQIGERIFIDPKDFSNYVKWGPVGEHGLKKALEEFDKLHLNG